MELLVAFATEDNEKLKNDGHFGDAGFYLVYKMTKDSTEFLEKIENPKFAENHHIKGGDPNKAKGMSGLLKNVDVLVSRQFGTNITRMIKKFVCVLPRVETIEEAIEKVQQSYERILEEKRKDIRKPIIIRN